MLFTLLLPLIFSTPSHAVEEFSCSTTKGLLHIAEYLVCEANPQLSSCANLATQITGRVITTPGKQRIQERLKKAKEHFFARKIVIPGRSKREIQREMQASWALVAEHIESGGTLDSDFFRRAVQKRLSHVPTENPEDPDQMEDAFEKTVLSSAMSMAQSVFISSLLDSVSEGVQSTIWNLIAFTVRTFGTQSTDLLGGVVFGAVMNSLHGTPTACSDAEDLYIYRVAKSEMGGFTSHCETVYEANDTVIHFLESSRDNQLNAMKNESVCHFYKTFYEKNLSRPIFTSLQCDGAQGFTLKFKEPDESKYSVHALYFDKSYISQINITRNAGAQSPMQFDEEGKPTYGLYEERKDFYRHLKLFITEARDCCNSKPEDYAVCSKAFNSDSEL